MSVADRLNKLTTDITSAYTSIENKGGTIPANKNTNNLSTAIDSIEVIEQATAEGESLSLTNTKAMPYSDYVVKGKSEQNGEPSPSNPSEIHSVADDVNLLSGLSIYTANHIISPKLELEIGTYTFSYIGDSSSGLYIRKNNATTGEVLLERYNTTRITFTVIEKGDYYIDLYLSGDWNTKTVTKEQLKKGSTLLPYSPYNQGTVTIKQRGKNLWTSNLPILWKDEGSIVQDNNNGGIDMTIASSASLGYILYDLGLISNFAGKTLTFSISNEPNVLYKWCALVACNADGSNRQELKNFYELNNQITYTVGNNYSQTHLTVRLYIAEATGGQTYSINNVQVEENSEKTSYEPYQTPHDYTFQTSPLRSLPNGVKDTIEEDGIHRRVGRVILDGTETWINKNITDNNLLFSTEKIDNLFNTTNLTNIISNYFGVNSNLWTNDNEGTCLFNMSASLRFRINKNLLNDISTVANAINSMKSWLSNNPTEVLYELATEVIEPLSQNQANTLLDIIKTGSYEGTTNIYTDEDVKPTIGVGYYKKG